MSCGAKTYYDHACTKAYPCPEKGHHPPVCIRGPAGPSSPYEPSSFFQVALAQTFPFTSPTVVPFNIVCAGKADFSFDKTTGEFVTPAIGFYQFSFAVTMSNQGGVSSSASANVSVDGNFLSSVTCTLSVGATQTLAGNVILQLLPEQRVGLIVTTSGGAAVQGPATIAAPPYPTTFMGFSFF